MYDLSDMCPEPTNEEREADNQMSEYMRELNELWEAQKMRIIMQAMAKSL